MTARNVLVFTCIGGVAAVRLSKFTTGLNPDKPPDSPTAYNGMHWPTHVVPKSEGHFYGIGDWGGDGAIGESWTNPGVSAHRKIQVEDQWAQRNVARVMKKHAAEVDPDFVLNAGDNFYPGGYNTKCTNKWNGINHAFHDPTHQFEHRFQNMYAGDGLDGKPWYGVLGNHDYGGMHYDQGWDAQIYHTWARHPSKGPKWVMPAQFYTTTIKYNDFEVDLIMLDSNFMDAHKVGTDLHHNLCQRGVKCWGITEDKCFDYFQNLWRENIAMLKKHLAKSTARWKFIVSHFPAPSIAASIGRSIENVDLIFTGHAHMQNIANCKGADQKKKETLCVISGGGGGVSADCVPSKDGHDVCYGFVHFKVTKDNLAAEIRSWGGPNGDALIMRNMTKSPKSSGTSLP